MKIPNARRLFLKSISQATLRAGILGGGLLPILANAATTSRGGYKALVCINLDGGNDSFNTVVPMSAHDYSQYHKYRGLIAIEKGRLHPIHLSGSSGEYGLHPSLDKLSDLFNKKKMAIIANVGNLVEPVNKEDYLTSRARLPENLLSHYDQVISSQRLSDNVDSGWAGRLEEIMASYNINQQLAMNITISGDNYLQRGSLKVPFKVRDSGANVIDMLDGEPHIRNTILRSKLYKDLIGRQRENLLQQYYSEVQLNAWVMSAYVADILRNQPSIYLPISEIKDDGNFSQSLNMVARLIAANEAFDVQRQIFYISLGSFDSHSNQSVTHASLLKILNDGIEAFQSSLEIMGYSDNVTIFTTSEFGRTFSCNGDGTDHGWGGHHFVCGGAVKGQKIYGTMPNLLPSGECDIGKGRIIPSISFDQYAATLCKWFGVPKDDLHQVLPNLANFSQKNIGFLR